MDTLTVKQPNAAGFIIDYSRPIDRPDVRPVGCGLEADRRYSVYKPGTPGNLVSCVDAETAMEAWRGTEADKPQAAHTPGQVLAAIWGAAVAVAGEAGAWGAIADLDGYIDERGGERFAALADYAQGHSGAEDESQNRAACVQAAAPELLAALHTALDQLEGARDFILRFDDSDEGEIETSKGISATIEELEAVLAKAEGR